MLRKIALCVAVFVCVSCGAVNKHRLPTNESDCAAAGGTWNPVETLREERYCDLKTADAGKRCFDSMQCESSCFAAEKAEVGSWAIGHCAGWLRLPLHSRQGENPRLASPCARRRHG